MALFPADSTTPAHPEKFYLTKASWYLAKVVLSLAHLQIVSTFFLVNQNCHRCLFYGHFPKLKTFAVLWWNLGVDMQSDQWTVHLGSHMATYGTFALLSAYSNLPNFKGGSSMATFLSYEVLITQTVILSWPIFRVYKKWPYNYQSWQS